MIMDYKYLYLHELRRIIRPLSQEVKDEIYYDLIKLEDWVLPDLDELEEYFNALDFDINVMLWKFILRELTFIHHCKIRNDRVILMLKTIKEEKLKIKPFVLTRAPFCPSLITNVKGYFLGTLKIKKYDRSYQYQDIYNDTEIKYLKR